jgi:hypothetical protein
MEYLTVKDMAEKLGLKRNTIQRRLFLRGVKPLCKDAIYDPSALDAISDFGPKGFQPKQKSDTD